MPAPKRLMTAEEHEAKKLAERNAKKKAQRKARKPTIPHKR